MKSLEVTTIYITTCLHLNLSDQLCQGGLNQEKSLPSGLVTMIETSRQHFQPIEEEATSGKANPYLSDTSSISSNTLITTTLDMITTSAGQETSRHSKNSQSGSI